MLKVMNHHCSIRLLKCNKMKIGLFPGSFDPFTIGHYSIVKRAIPLFDKIIIAIGINQDKKCLFTTEERVKKIKEIYSKENKISISTYKGLTIDFAKKENAKYIIKGVRSIKDFEYERNQAEINKQIGNVETIFLITEPQLACISSSMVRELISFGYNVDKFLPKKI